MKNKYKSPLDIAIILVSHCLPPLTVLWALLWIFIPLAIWLQDLGPIFYSQARIGKDGRIFLIRKFRTMIPNAESVTGAVWSQTNDPRITKIGKILRWTALDELPQLWNIIRGDMTLVGPRAERPELHSKFASEIPEFERRLEVRPGLTGLAQINGPYDLPPEEKILYDIEYISKMDLLLDIQIILLSVWYTIRGKWAHPNHPRP